MKASEAQKKAFKRYQRKIIRYRFNFNKENEFEEEIVKKFDDICENFSSKKAAFVYLVEKEDI